MSRTVLVVGGAGYIGSHTVKTLARRGDRIIVLDNLSKGHFEAVAAAGENIPLITGDLGDEALLARIFAENRIDAVMHFAGLIEVGASVREPERYYDNNFVKVQRLLASMRRAGVNRFVFSSTAATFGNPSSPTINEKHTQKPINPYGNTKLAVEMYLRDLAGAHSDFHYCIFRYFNACGGDSEGKLGYSYEPATHLIPIIMQAASGRRPHLSVFGTDYPTPDGTCVRDYIHVSDLAAAHILGMDRMLKENISDDFNLGNGAGYSVKQIIDAAKNAAGVDFKIEYGPRREGDPAFLVADPSKAKKILGWVPQYGLDEICSSAWYWERHKNF